MKVFVDEQIDRSISTITYLQNSVPLSIQINIKKNRKFRRNDRCCNNGIYSVEDGG